MELTYPAGREAVLAILPHRDPFVWVSRIVSCEPGIAIEAQFDVAPDLPLFAGHFPSHPVLPGVIVMEALAQAASCCILLARDGCGQVGFLTGIEKAKFRRQVLPGDTLRLCARIVKSSSRLCVAEVEAFVGDELAASAVQKYVLAKES